MFTENIYFLHFIHIGYYYNNKNHSQIEKSLKKVKCMINDF